MLIKINLRLDISNYVVFQYFVHCDFNSTYIIIKNYKRARVRQVQHVSKCKRPMHDPSLIPDT